MANPKILIVDDEPFNVDYLEQELEGFDCETITAINGQDALEKAASSAPDLILLDIMMPVMDGFEVLSRLKANPAAREIPVIVISASNSLQSVVKGIQLGAEDYLPKPFEPTLLYARVASCLEKKRLMDLQQLYLKSLERELDIAREIQIGFLPTELPVVEGWDIAAYFKAARDVAGDFYDAFLLPDGNLCCVIGDVCGKGVGAALFMTLFRSLIRASSTTDRLYDVNTAPVLSHAERLQRVISFTNNYVAETHEDTGMFSTVFIGIFNFQDNKLVYINCGNEPPVLLGREGALTALWPTSPIVGVIPDAPFCAREIPVDKNETLLAFTDGITDAMSMQDEPFGRERLYEFLRCADTAPATLLKDIQYQLSQYMGKAEQFDDITMLAIKRGM